MMGLAGFSPGLIATALAACLGVFAGCTKMQAPTGITLHVAPDGNDAWSGRRAETAGTNGPLATLEGARNAVRALKKSGALSNGVTVLVQAGTYPLKRAVDFAQEDSGSETAAVVYRAAPGAVVRITGGADVSGWESVTDAAVRDRLSAGVRDRVLVADLKARGLTDYGKPACAVSEKARRPPRRNCSSTTSR